MTANRRTRRVAGTAAALGAALAAYEAAVKPWQQRWGATDEELAVRLPGDELVAEPADQITRAITIEAAPEDIWPWIVQIGADRGGFYSYDALENLFGLRIHSADRVVDDWQQLAVGDPVYANAARTGGWRVMELRPHEVLVLQLADVASGRTVRRDEQLKWEFVWIFALRRASATTTRLLVRERTAFDSRLTRTLMAPIGAVSFVMTRRMLLGIKHRAEGRPRTNRPPAERLRPAHSGSFNV